MVFRQEEVSRFNVLFEERKALIRNFEGCTHLELWRQEGDAPVFFTYSHWIDHAALQNYRNSELFQDTWRRTKALFAEQAQAWSVAREDVVPGSQV